MLSRFLRRSASAAAVAWLAAIPLARMPAAEANRTPTIAITVPPFVEPEQAANRAAGETEFELTAAQQALELGFHTAARELFASVLRRATTPAALNSAAYGLASVEIAVDQPDAAEAALARVSEPSAARARMRRGLIALERRNLAEAARALENLSPDELPADEAAWVLVAQGWQRQLQYLEVQRRADDAERRGQSGEMQRFRAEADQWRQTALQGFSAALLRLRSEQAKARVELVRQRVLLLIAPPSPEMIRGAEKSLTENSGRDLAFGYARNLAVMLDLVGRKDEARRVLQEQLLRVSGAQRAAGDDMRLVLALIAGTTTPTGENELRRLLSEATDPNMRRNALELLAAGATDRDARDRLRGELDARIAEAPASPILEDLLFYRARLALNAKEFARAEEDAKQLLAQFPGSALRLPARLLQIESAWSQLLYRTTADAVARLLADSELSPEQRGALGVLQAEAAFRAEDYRAAATAYGAAAGNAVLPAGSTRGGLLFQQVLALSFAERAEDTPTALQLADTQALLDRLAGDARFDTVSRWQAEWNLAKMLQVRGQNVTAYERVNRLVAANGVASLPPELLLRMAWLQAKLSLEAGQPAATLGHVERLLAGPAAAGNAAVDAKLRDQVAGAAGLLRAQAYLQSKPAQVEQATAEFSRVRRQFPGSDAAVYSFIAMAGYYASVGNQAKAQGELQTLVADYGDSSYAPYAYYQLAAVLKQRGYDLYDEAYKKLEELVTRYPQQRKLVFYARMQQGEILREKNDFDRARRLYESLLREFPEPPDRFLAELELAHTLYGQWGNDRSRLDEPLQRFQRLFDTPSAPADVRVEAGCMLGKVAELRGDVAEARASWWKVVSRFLFDEKNAAKVQELGRYWLARTLYDYARVCEEAKQPEQARVAYELIVRHGLMGEYTARARLGVPQAAVPNVVVPGVP